MYGKYIVDYISAGKGFWRMVFRRKNNNKVSGGSQNGISDFLDILGNLRI